MKDFKTKYKTLLNAFGINTKLRYDHFMTQLEHESGLEPKRESLYYKTIEGARRVFKTPFDGKSDEFVSKYLFNSEKMANYVYANRMGNGDEASGDGFRFRAGGFIGVTGRANFLVMSKDTRIDFINDPDIINTEANALISALWYWQKANLNKHADNDDLEAISDIINIGRQTKAQGDSNGFKHRKELYGKYKKLAY